MTSPEMNAYTRIGFGFNPVYTNEEPRHDFQRGGVPVIGRTYLAAEWQEDQFSFILLLDYEAEKKVRISVHQWIETRNRWEETKVPPGFRHILLEWISILNLPDQL